MADTCVSDLTRLIRYLGCLLGWKQFCASISSIFLFLVAHYVGKRFYVLRYFSYKSQKHAGLTLVVILQSLISIFLLHLHLCFAQLAYCATLVAFSLLTDCIDEPNHLTLYLTRPNIYVNLPVSLSKGRLEDRQGEDNGSARLILLCYPLCSCRSVNILPRSRLWYFFSQPQNFYVLIWKNHTPKHRTSLSLCMYYYFLWLYFWVKFFTL